MKGALALQNEAMIDALRMCLGLEPLYRKHITSQIWDSMSFDHGNRRTRVTVTSNGTSRKVPSIQGEKVSTRETVITTSGVDRFLHKGMW